MWHEKCFSPVYRRESACDSESLSVIVEMDIVGATAPNLNEIREEHGH